MKRAGLLSVLWLMVVLLGVGWTGISRRSPVVSAHAAEITPRTSARTASLRAVGGLTDASGHVVPLVHYARIASATTVADQLLLALAEPERIVALSEYGRAHSDAPHLYGARATISGLAHLERLLSLRVDLLITNHLGAQPEMARAREAGMAVFNLGEMRGLSTLIPNIHAVAALLGDPERGRRYAEKLVRRMEAVAQDIPQSSRKGAMYVASYGNKLFGGTKGSSYHDVLTHAGLIDVAAEAYRDWPHYDPEQLLALDPDIIVTSEGLGAGLCAVSGLDRLRACADGRKGIIELPGDLLGDPGARMLEAAERLRDRVYGPPSGSRARATGEHP